MSLEIKNLSKSFGDKQLFSNLSYKFPSIGSVAVIGESGAGKTTLLRMIAELDKDYIGEIIKSRKENVSFAFQEHRLFSTVSALDNLRLVSFSSDDHEAYKRSEEMLLSLGFTKEDTALFPCELSGGMKQRVSLARAFLKDSGILLLDEPTKELDEENISLVLNEIKRQSQHRLVIIVTHRLDDISMLGAEIIKI